MQHENNPQVTTKHVFIVTYGRSGSTLLQKLLNSSEGVCIRGENNDVLLGLVKSWSAFAREQEVYHLRRSKKVVRDDHPWYGINLSNGETFGRHLAEIFTRDVLFPPENTLISGFKEIRWHREPEWFEARMDFLKTFFVDAKFLINTRNHEDVARSSWWKTMPRDEVLAQLGAAEDLYLNWQSRHPEISCHLHFDDYVADPSRLKPAFDLIGLPFSRERMESVLQTRLQH